MTPVQITGNQIGSEEIISRHIADRAIHAKHFTRGSVTRQTIANREVLVQHLDPPVEYRLLPPPTSQGSDWRAALENTPSQPSASNPFLTFNDVKLRVNFWLPPMKKLPNAVNDPPGSIRINLEDSTLYYVTDNNDVGGFTFAPVSFSHLNATDLEESDDHRHVTTPQRQLLDTWISSNASNVLNRSSLIQRYSWQAITEALKTSCSFVNIDAAAHFRLGETYQVNDDGFAVPGNLNEGGVNFNQVEAYRSLLTNEKLSPEFSYTEIHGTNNFSVPFQVRVNPSRTIHRMGTLQGSYQPTQSYEASENTIFYNESISLNHGLLPLDRTMYMFNSTSTLETNNSGYKIGNICTRGAELIGEHEQKNIQLTGIEFDETNMIVKHKVEFPPGVDSSPLINKNLRVNAIDLGERGIQLAQSLLVKDITEAHVPKKPEKTWLFQDGDGASWMVSLTNNLVYIWFIARDSSEIFTVDTTTYPTGDPFVSRQWNLLDVELVHRYDNNSLQVHLVFFGKETSGQVRLYMSGGLAPGSGPVNSSYSITMYELTGELQERFDVLTARELNDIQDPRVIRSSRQRFNSVTQCGLAFKNRNELYLGAADWVLDEDEPSGYAISIALKRAQNAMRAVGSYEVEGLDDNGFVLAAELLPHRHIASAVVRFGQFGALSVSDTWYNGYVFTSHETNIKDFRVISEQPYRKQSDVDSKIGAAANRFVHVIMLRESGVLNAVTLRLTGTSSEGAYANNTFYVIQDRDIADGVMRIDASIGGPTGWIFYTDMSGNKKYVQTSWKTRQADNSDTVSIDDPDWDQPKLWKTSNSELVDANTLHLNYSNNWFFPVTTGDLNLQVAELNPAQEKGAYVIYIRAIEIVGELCGCLKTCHLTATGASSPGWLGTSIVPVVEKDTGHQIIITMGGMDTEEARPIATNTINQAVITPHTGLTSQFNDVSLFSVKTPENATAEMPLNMSYGSSVALADGFNNFWIMTFGGLFTGRPYSEGERSHYFQKFLFSRLTSSSDTRLTMISSSSSLISSSVSGGPGSMIFTHFLNGEWILYIINSSGEVFFHRLNTDTLANGLGTDASYTSPTSDEFVEVGTSNEVTRDTSPSSYLTDTSYVQWEGQALVQYPSKAAAGQKPNVTWAVFVEANTDFERSDVKVLYVNNSQTIQTHVPLPDQLTWYTCNLVDNSSSPSPRVEGQLTTLGTVSRATMKARVDSDCESEGAVFLLHGGRSVIDNSILDDVWMLEVWHNSTSNVTAPTMFKHRWTKMQTSIGLSTPGPICGAGTASLPMRLDRGSNTYSLPRTFTMGGSSSQSNVHMHPSYLSVIEWPNLWNVSSLDTRTKITNGKGPYLTNVGSAIIIGPIDVTNWTAVKFKLETDIGDLVDRIEGQALALGDRTSIRWLVSFDPINDLWLRWCIFQSAPVIVGGWDSTYEGQGITSDMLFTCGTKISPYDLWEYDLNPSETDWIHRNTHAGSWDSNENSMWILVGLKTTTPSLTPILKSITIDYKVSVGDVFCKNFDNGVLFTHEGQQGLAMMVRTPESNTFDTVKLSLVTQKNK